MDHRHITPRGPPPSSFIFPFQSHPGNPDPLPSRSRRSSVDSFDIPSPNIPFSHSRSNSFSSNDIYRASVAAPLTDTPPPIRRSHSQTFRPPFQSPASRPGSSLWFPPSPRISPSPSSSALALPKKPYTTTTQKPPAPSTRLPTKLKPADKPWLAEKDARARAAWWLTLSCLLLGLAAAAVLCWRGVQTVHVLDPARLCLVLEDHFAALDTDHTWSRDVELGGFGNGEFQIATADPANAYAKNGNLYIRPTLTSAALGAQQVLANGSYTVPGCTSANKTACTATSDGHTTAINPVMSARLSTKGSASIRYGKVEVRAKLPRGDWLWPAIWMLPENNTYGPWPLSGEIDLMEARGNAPSYAGQGTNYVRGSLHYGALPALARTLYGWYATKRGSFAAGFHTYGMEWDAGFVRLYVDSRVHAVLDLRITGGAGGFFWREGRFPATAVNGSAEVVVEDVWSGGGAAAPFDQEFYLVLDLAVGGTSGWFPDNVGGKPWHDGSSTAMRDFALAQSDWAASWATSEDDLAFRVDYVKMWKLC